MEDEEGLLEGVMSLPVQRAIKKVESVIVPSFVGVKPIGNGAAVERLERLGAKFTAFYWDY